MRILPITNQYHNRKNVQPAFKSTTYEDKKIIERDVFSITGETSLFSNPISPSQNILGVRIVRENNRTVNLVSRYNSLCCPRTFHPLGSIYSCRFLVCNSLPCKGRGV